MLKILIENSLFIKNVSIYHFLDKGRTLNFDRSLLLAACSQITAEIFCWFPTFVCRKPASQSRPLLTLDNLVLEMTNMIILFHSLEQKHLLRAEFKCISHKCRSITNAPKPPHLLKKALSAKVCSHLCVCYYMCQWPKKQVVRD